MLNQYEQLEGRLQDLRAWVGNTHAILNSKQYDSETDADSPNDRLQRCEVSAPPALKHVLFALLCCLNLMSLLGRPVSVLAFLRKCDFPFEK